MYRLRKFVPLMRSLVVGVLATLSVSWCCAIIIFPTPTALLSSQGHTQHGDSRDLLTVCNIAQAGVCRVFVWWGEMPISGPMSTTDAYTLLPPWSMVPSYDKRLLDNGTLIRVTDARGWPFLSLKSTWDIVAQAANATWFQGLHVKRICGGVRLTKREPDAKSFLAHFQVLPLTIMPRGFAMNVLIFGGFWAILEGAYTIARCVRRRWRLYRTCCVCCGYSLHDLQSENCPECGAAIIRAEGDSSNV